MQIDSPNDFEDLVNPELATNSSAIPAVEPGNFMEDYVAPVSEQNDPQGIVGDNNNPLDCTYYPPPTTGGSRFPQQNVNLPVHHPPRPTTGGKHPLPVHPTTGGKHPPLTFRPTTGGKHPPSHPQIGGKSPALVELRRQVGTHYEPDFYNEMLGREREQGIRRKKRPQPDELDYFQSEESDESSNSDSDD